MIKTFEEWYTDDLNEPVVQFIQEGYEGALAESKAHYEMEKIAIHEYYDLKIKELMGTTEEFKGSKKNNGKLS